MDADIRFWLASAGAIFLLKLFALWRSPQPPHAGGTAAFLLAWPGVFPDCFRHRYAGLLIEPRAFMAAWARMMAGLATIFLLALFAPQLQVEVLGLAGIAALLLALHSGFADLLPWLLRWAGFRVPLLFDRPWAARSLTEFWGRRWNLAFVEMNRRYFLRRIDVVWGHPASRFALFALSGLLHEMALSFPARAGWGGPLGYFLLQGALVAVEGRFGIATRPWSRLWTWFWILAPSPWLFHAPIRAAVIVPFYGWLHELLLQHPAEWYLSHLLSLAAIGQICLLSVSFQLPVRLRWKEDIPKLSRFNQKLFYVYSGYIVLCIVGFATLTWNLHGSMLAGDPAARGLAAFIAIFWSFRIAVDFAWYDHRDWPQGNALVLGHAALTTLFFGLAGVYWWVVWRAEVP